MRKVFCVIFSSLLILSSCKYRTADNHKGNNVIGDAVGENVAVLNVYTFDESPLYDTLTTDNIIESVHFIRLENSKEALMSGADNVSRINDKYVIYANNAFERTVKIFGSDGSYLKDAFKLGRGPKEVVRIAYFSCNDSTKKITILGMLDEKALKYDLLTDNIERYRLSFDYGKRLTNLIALPSGDYLALNGKYPEKNNDPYPYLFLLNDKLEIAKSLSDKKDRHKKMVEGVTEGPDLHMFLRPYKDGAIFHDLLNDTIFYVDDNLSLTPVAIFDMGKKKPTMKENTYDNIKKKAEKIYLYDAKITDKYLFGSYFYNNEVYESIWDYKTGKLIYTSHNKLSGLRINLNGTAFRVYGYGIIGNKLLAIINASDLLDVLPDLKPDDNSVLIEITLK